MGGLVDGKVALITGAASGIGRAAALTFAREGALVVAADRDSDGGEITVEAVRSGGGQATFRQCDVTSEDDVRALVAAVVDAHGRLDCAHNNAGITGAMGAVHQLEREAWEHTLTVNLTGIFLCMKHELVQMRAQGSGAIVNTASAAGLVGVPGLSPYCASKHAIIGLTKTAALENAAAGVRVNAVLPGSIDTPMLHGYMSLGPAVEKAIKASQPGGRLGLPEEIAEAVVWLSSDRASFVTGTPMLVDGGAVAGG
jgi:NAD(P)-dependent dehydrogenase (short-subunit alcohol dehydrogenase family)